VSSGRPERAAAPASVRLTPPIEMTGDPRFAPRVKRLAFTSLVALGLVWGLAIATLEAPPLVDASLAAGWVLMPATLFASLVRPRLRYGLVVPSTLVGVGLLAVSIAWLPGDPVAAAGWLMMTAGVLMGAVLGLWFWYRLFPVPASLDDPFSKGRWGLVGLHIALIVVGLVLAARPLR
jgi:hypothetical protein